MTIEAKTSQPPAFAQRIQVRAHTLLADVSEELGGTDAAPGPHDYFDASLAACKTLTAHWYAKRSGMALDSVDVRIERDDTQERAGIYKLYVHMTYHGALSDAERHKLHAAVSRCPVHKLMTSTEVVIETAPL